jgi:uncharacterized FAD-dependent dehydrogenase
MGNTHMNTEKILICSADEAYQKEQFETRLKQTLSVEQVPYYRIIKRSVDARQKPVKVRVVVNIYEDEQSYLENLPKTFQYPNVSQGKPIIIIGAGPAGLFAALRIGSLGFKPIVLERGKMVRDRRRDLANLNRTGLVHEDSNYCFGEGGAGTYSDGKLYTRSTKRGSIECVLQHLYQHGAPEDILYEAHPHIGTNRLPKVIESIRNQIIAMGGEVHFETKVVGLLEKQIHQQRQIQGVQTADGRVFLSDRVILATGHSARDIFELLVESKIQVEAKPFALGVRAEHPQILIDQIQFKGQKPSILGSASYRLVTQADQRGVFSFCMCPGGIIAPAMTAAKEIVVNGWSPYLRNGKFANSGIVVSIEKEDFDPKQSNDPLAALRYQQRVERKAYEIGNVLRQKTEDCNLAIAPAQKLLDFVKKKTSSQVGDCSYIPGIFSADLREVLPSAVSKRLALGLSDFGKHMKGYLSEDAHIVGVESRTSSPVRIPRTEDLEHPELMGFYPCGEGAGYAGGIVSAAIDGMKCAEKAVHQFAIQHHLNVEDCWQIQHDD